MLDALAGCIVGSLLTLLVLRLTSRRRLVVPPTIDSRRLAEILVSSIETEMERLGAVTRLGRAKTSSWMTRK